MSKKRILVDVLTIASAVAVAPFVEPDSGVQIGIAWLAILPAIISAAGRGIAAASSRPEIPDDQLQSFGQRAVASAVNEAQEAARGQLAAARDFAERDITIPGFDVQGMVGDVNVEGLSDDVNLGITQATADIIGQDMTFPGLDFGSEDGEGGSVEDNDRRAVPRDRTGGDVDTGNVTFNQFPGDPRAPTGVRDILNAGPGIDLDPSPGEADFDVGPRGSVEDPRAANPNEIGGISAPRGRVTTTEEFDFSTIEDKEEALNGIAQLLQIMERGQGVGTV